MERDGREKRRLTRNQSMITRTSLLAAALLLLAAPVQAATFTFDFSNVNGAVSGEVSGTIVLPDGNGTFAATSVMIDSILRPLVSERRQ